MVIFSNNFCSSILFTPHASVLYISSLLVLSSFSSVLLSIFIPWTLSFHFLPPSPPFFIPILPVQKCNMPSTYSFPIVKISYILWWLMWSLVQSTYRSNSRFVSGRTRIPTDNQKARTEVVLWTVYYATSWGTKRKSSGVWLIWIIQWNKQLWRSGLPC